MITFFFFSSKVKEGYDWLFILGKKQVDTIKPIGGYHVGNPPALIFST